MCQQQKITLSQQTRHYRHRSPSSQLYQLRRLQNAIEQFMITGSAVDSHRVQLCSKTVASFRLTVKPSPIKSVEEEPISLSLITGNEETQKTPCETMIPCELQSIIVEESNQLVSENCDEQILPLINHFTVLDFWISAAFDSLMVQPPTLIPKDPSTLVIFDDVLAEMLAFTDVTKLNLDTIDLKCFIKMNNDQPWYWNFKLDMQLCLYCATFSSRVSSIMAIQLSRKYNINPRLVLAYHVEVMTNTSNIIHDCNYLTENQRHQLQKLKNEQWQYMFDDIMAQKFGFKSAYHMNLGINPQDYVPLSKSTDFDEMVEGILHEPKILL